MSEFYGRISIVSPNDEIVKEKEKYDFACAWAASVLCLHIFGIWSIVTQNFLHRSKTKMKMTRKEDESTYIFSPYLLRVAMHGKQL